MDRIDLADTRVSIEAGSAVVKVNDLPKLVRVEIHIGGAVVAIRSQKTWRRLRIGRRIVISPIGLWR